MTQQPSSDLALQWMLRIYNEVQDIKKRMITRDDLTALISQVQEHEKVLFRGNGRKPLVTRIELIEARMDGVRKEQEDDEHKPSGWDKFTDRYGAPIITALVIAIILFVANVITESWLHVQFGISPGVVIPTVHP